MNFNVFHPRSLKARVTLFTLTIFLLGIWSLAIFESRMLHEDMQHMLSDQQFSTVSLLASKVNQELNDRLIALEKIAKGISPAILDNTVALQTFLEQHILLQSLFNGGAFVTGIDGATTASIPFFAERIGNNYMDRDYISTALKEGKSIIGRPVMGRVLHSPIFAIAAPIRDTRAKVIGVLAGVTDLGKPNFLDNITEGHYGKTGGYFLVAPQYRLIVTASDKTRIMKQFPAPGINPVLDNYLRGKEGSDVYVNPLGVEVLGSAKGIPVAGWFMGVILPTQEAFAPIRAMQQRKLLTTIFISLLVGFLAWWMLTRLLSPIHNAARMLATLSDTDQPPQPMPINSQDEIGELIGGFNRLLETLKQRDEAQRESEEMHKEMIANISDVIAIMDRDGTIRYKSPNIEKWFGWQPEDLVGSDGWETVHPGDLERIQKEFSGFLDKDNSVATVEYRYKCKDGSYKLIELTAANLTNDPIIRGILVNYYDITERKLVEKAYKDSEFKYRSLIEHSSDVVFCVDRNGEYKFVNQVFASTFGRTPDYFMGKTFWDIYPKKHADYRQAASSRVFETGESESVEVVVPLPDRTLYFIAKTNPVRDETGKVVLNLTHATDITALKRIEAEKLELEAQNRQLQKAESLGRMAGAIAHHFNNQLYAVMGNLEIAMDDLPLGVNSNKNLVSAMQAACKAADVSQLMLTYLGQTPGKHEPIDMSETCRKSLTLLQAAIPKGIVLNADFPSTGPVISGDADQIQQVLINLTTNAWESISDNNQGSIDLTIKTAYHTDIPTLKRFPIDWRTQCIPYACLEVSDNGCGISNKDIERLFDPFFTTKFTGRGLGLPVVMGIVKAHGGGVTVESESWRGSTFRIFLPLTTDEVTSRPDLPAIPVALMTKKAEEISRMEGGGTVLLIEDDELVRDMTKVMLTRLGYCVLDAKDGFEALEIFQQHQDEILIILSDLTMPRMNGWDTLVALRELSPDIPVILSSGYDEAQVMAGEHPELPNAFLGKPYQLNGLRDTISRVLANKA